MLVTGERCLVTHDMCHMTCDTCIYFLFLKIAKGFFLHITKFVPKIVFFLLPNVSEFS